jgi:hypothetical protein
MPRQKLIVAPKLLPFFDLPDGIPSTFAVAIRWLTIPREGETQIEEMIRLERISTLSQVVRDRWDSKFRSREIRSEDKIYDKIKSKLFNATLDLIQELHLLEPEIFGNVAETFALVIHENQIDALSLCSPDALTKKIDARKIMQFQNRAIKALENPFSLEYTPHTFTFIEEAQKIAQTKDNFRRRYYTPFREAREALITYLIKNALLFRKTDSGFSVRQQAKTHKTLTGCGFQTERSSCVSIGKA